MQNSQPALHGWYVHGALFRITNRRCIAFCLVLYRYGLNKVYSFDIVVHLKQNTISYTRSQTAYMSTAVTLNTQNYRYKF